MPLSGKYLGRDDVIWASRTCCRRTFRTSTRSLFLVNHVTATNWMAEMGSDPFAQVANVRSRQIHSRVNARDFLESSAW